MPPRFPPWTLLPLYFKPRVPGINEAKRHITQTALLQPTFFYIGHRYTRRSHIYTDASNTQEISSYGLYVTLKGQSLSYQLQRMASSTTAELHEIKKATLYTLRPTPTRWVIFTDSKGTQVLFSLSNKTNYHQISFN